jgi:hypothetical protein
MTKKMEAIMNNHELTNVGKTYALENYKRSKTVKNNMKLYVQVADLIKTLQNQQ